MQLYIDGKAIQARPQQSLRELVCALGLDDRYLSRRPLAARIAGEVFTLNYIPQREQEAEGDRPSMRRAMAASGGQVKLLRYGDSAAVYNQVLEEQRRASGVQGAKNLVLTEKDRGFLLYSGYCEPLNF